MTRMTCKERLLAAIRHEEPDLVPVSPRTWAWELEYYGSESWLYHLRAAREFDFDPLVTVSNPCTNYVESLRAGYDELHDIRVHLDIERAASCTRVSRTIETPAGRLSDRTLTPKPNTGYGASPNPHWEERLVKGPEDLPALAFLVAEPSPAQYLDVAALQDEVGERGLVQVYISSPIDHYAGWSMDLENLMVASLQQPEFLAALLRLFQDMILAQTRCALEAGVKVIFTPWYFASASVGWSPTFYQRFILPLVREQVMLVHSGGGLYHYYDDGKLMGILPWLAEAGVDLLSTLPPPPTGDTDLRLAKMLVGDRICLNGNIDVVNVIKAGTPDSVRATVRQAILDAAPGGGFILGTSDSIRDAPQENVVAYFQAARRYGNYRHLG